jgi:hypothetical protein
MGFSEQIISNLTRYQPQRPALFDISMGVPTGFGTGSVTALRFNPVSLEYGLGQSFSTPTKELETFDWSYYGIKRKIPVRRKFSQFSVSFLLDDFLAIAGWFEYWMDIIINPFSDYIEDYNPAISAGYVSLIPVDSNFQYGTALYFSEAYPVQILPLEFDTSRRNESMRYTVMFNCREYLFDGANYSTRGRAKPSE